MKLYVGTYAKYNNGDLSGAWLDLDKFANAEEFEAECKRIHRDEHDPELMFQDVETDPGCDWQEGLYSESSIPSDYWTLKAEAEAEAKKSASRPKSAERMEQERLCAVYMEARGYDRSTDRRAKSYDRERDVIMKRDRFNEQGETMKEKVENEGEDRVRCTFELTKDEAAKLCDMRCEPKPSTAAAQVVRMAIKAVLSTRPE